MFLSALSLVLALFVALRVKKVLDPVTGMRSVTGQEHISAVPTGMTVPEAGELIDHNGAAFELPAADASGRWLLAFLSSECPGCKVQLPRYKKWVDSLGISPDRVITVVTGDESDGVEQYKTELGELSRVTHLDTSSPFVENMGVDVWPAYLVISEGKVQYSALSSSRLARIDGALFQEPESTPALAGGTA
ncbi:hypothetical protein VT50_0217080 [Streptomyces antioxidans]|uniref:Thioredoxin domain-containing protein n=1 Tax=Streptomyces antioxidans TaxID=1507734 RepID=A0A1V4D4Y6_9ACTN|nr:hypothetical protein VT50_0217080 [Streptomyces antioxidans]